MADDDSAQDLSLRLQSPRDPAAYRQGHAAAVQTRRRKPKTVWA